MAAETTEYVIATAREADVKFIRLWFTDILGSLKSFAITVGELEGALERGMGFDGSSIEGFARIDESDMVARPDPSTFVVLPWRPQQHRVARMFCDIYMPDGAPFRRRPALRAAPPTRARAGGRLHVLRGPRAGVVLLQGAGHAGAARRRRLLST